jgi:hypothetical protein
VKVRIGRGRTGWRGGTESELEVDITEAFRLRSAKVGGYDGSGDEVETWTDIIQSGI